MEPEILTEYIESDMFGFSVKRWTNFSSEKKKLTSASKL
jgi:hypothetical protein